MCRFLRFVHLARVPLLSLLSMILIGPVGDRYAPGIVLGLLDMGQSRSAFFWVSLATFLLQASAVYALNLIVLYGPLRFSDLRFRKRDRAGKLRDQVRIFLFASIPSALLLVWVWRTTPLAFASKALAVALALVVMSAIVALGLYAKAWLSHPELNSVDSPSMIVPLPGSVSGALDGISQRRPERSVKRLPGLGESIRRFLIRMLAPFGSGYFIQAKDHSLHFRRGHTQAAFLFLVSAGIYLWLGLTERAVLSVDHPPEWLRKLAGVPSLAYVLFALMLACWLFSGLSFFLDKYRIPTLTTFLAGCLLTSFVAPESDHFFRVREAAGVTRGERPSAILGRHSTTPILIAAEGGGIQAAAWTAEIIRRLGRELAPDVPDFESRIALISGVSGGALGAIAVGAHFGDLEAAARDAAESSLQEVAWGWMSADVLRATLPWFGNHRVDRGWALERSWEQRLGLSEVFISDWAQKTTSGFPAFIFNTTWVETGRPLVISTSDFPQNHTLGLTGFKDVWSDFDVRVSTAARLSASFPFVSPAARPDGYSIFNADRHLVDGGYFDNFGLYSLIGWLSEALADNSYTGSPNILVLQIRSFPPAALDPDTVGTQRQGWFAQAYAPLKTMMNTRVAGQVRQAQALMNYFSASRLAKFSIFPVDLSYSTTQPECLDPPLSWKLTAVQAACVKNAQIWNEPVKMKCIKEFLMQASSTPVALRPECWTIE